MKESDTRIYVTEHRRNYEAAVRQLDTKAIRDRAQWLVDRGLHPVPINPATESVPDPHNPEKPLLYQTIGKKPTYKAWPAAALENTIRPSEWPDGWQVGVLCGTAVERNGQRYYVTDIDKDKGNIASVWRCVGSALGLTRGYAWGRDGKPDSHELYLADAPHNTTTGNPLYEGIAEYRCQSRSGEYAPYAHQSIMPPSIWTKGDRVEQIRLESDSAPEPPTVSADLLMKVLRWSVAICLLAPLFPDAPRHSIRWALFVEMHDAGWPIDDAVKFVTVLDQFSVNPDRSASKFLSEARNQYESAAANKPNLMRTGTIIHTVGLDKREQVAKVMKLLGVSTTRDESTKAETPSTTTLDLLQVLRNKSPLKLPHQPIEYLIDGLVVKGMFTVVSGKGSCGKSSIIYHWCMEFIRSGCDVLYLDRDNCLSAVQAGLNRTIGNQLPDNFFYWGDWLTDEAGNELAVEGMGPPLVNLVRRMKSPVIIFDTLRKFARCDENDNTEMGNFISEMKHLTKRHGATVILVHHDNKEGSGYRGASSLRDDVDTLLQVESIKDPETTKIQTLTIRPDKGKVLLHSTTYTFGEHGRPLLLQESIDSRLMAIISRNPGITPDAVEKEAARLSVGTREKVRAWIKQTDTIERRSVSGRKKGRPVSGLYLRASSNALPIGESA